MLTTKYTVKMFHMRFNLGTIYLENTNSFFPFFLRKLTTAKPLHQIARGRTDVSSFGGIFNILIIVNYFYILHLNLI